MIIMKPEENSTAVIFSILYSIIEPSMWIGKDRKKASFYLEIWISAVVPALEKHI